MQNLLAGGLGYRGNNTRAICRARNHSILVRKAVWTDPVPEDEVKGKNMAEEREGRVKHA